jgi:hypothetical protein
MATVRLDVFSDSLAGTTPEVIPISPAQRLPMTVTLKSANAGRLIEFSTDGGSEYFTPTYDKTSSTMIVVVATARISHVRFTGAAADTWSVM